MIGWAFGERVFTFPEKAGTTAGVDFLGERCFGWTLRETCGIILFFNSSRIHVGWQSPGWQDSFMGETS
jgi:hypothetical protein